MIGIISALFGINKIDFRKLVEEGAIVIDVRSPGEFKSGHIEKSKNIPLNQLNSTWSKIPKDKTIITCCASGVRSAQAKSILFSNGIEKVVNGGGWRSLESKIR